MADPTDRRYRISRDQWDRVNCIVVEHLPGIPRQLKSLGVYSECFELGQDTGALDLALAILVDHAAVPFDHAVTAFRQGFRTANSRLVHVWMKHSRLRDQRLLKDLTRKGEIIEVNEWELQRLIHYGFLTHLDEQDFLKVVAVSEQSMEKHTREDGTVVYHREAQKEHYSKPGAEGEAG